MFIRSTPQVGCSTRYAAIDLGSHNCRLLIAEAARAGRLHVLGAISRPVRLAEGVAATGRLTDAAMHRALSVLSLFASRLRQEEIVRVSAVATAACRQAANAAAFIEQARNETGIPLQAISAAEEAHLTLEGCRDVLDLQARRALLFDIGGGSTELIWIDPTRGAPSPVLGMLSLPLGVVNLAERLGCDRVEPNVYAEILNELDGAFADFDLTYGLSDAVREGGVQLIATSGTVTTLAAVILGLRRYRRSRIDGLVLDREMVWHIAQRFSRSDWQERASVPCIGADRADLVVPGCAILQAILRRWRVGQLTVVDRGVREGLVLKMLAESQRTLGDS